MTPPKLDRIARALYALHARRWSIPLTWDEISEGMRRDYLEAAEVVAEVVTMAATC